MYCKALKILLQSQAKKYSYVLFPVPLFLCFEGNYFILKHRHICKHIDFPFFLLICFIISMANARGSWNLIGDSSTFVKGLAIQKRQTKTGVFNLLWDAVHWVHSLPMSMLSERSEQAARRMYSYKQHANKIEKLCVEHYTLSNCLLQVLWIVKYISRNRVSHSSSLLNDCLRIKVAP